MFLFFQLFSPHWVSFLRGSLRGPPWQLALNSGGSPFWHLSETSIPRHSMTTTTFLGLRCSKHIRSIYTSETMLRSHIDLRYDHRSIYTRSPRTDRMCRTWRMAGVHDPPGDEKHHPQPANDRSNQNEPPNARKPLRHVRWTGAQVESPLIGLKSTQLQKKLNLI